MAIGELLIDFTPSLTDEGTCFKQNAGGAPCNMLTMAQRLGTQTVFVGKVGDDQFGNYLKKTLESQGVSTEGLTLSKMYPTTLAFVHLSALGDRSFSFYRKGCADVMLNGADIDYALIDQVEALHFGSLSFTNEPSRTAVLDAVAYAKGKGKLITYDPNYRPPLWENETEAIQAMKLGLHYADIVKVSEEEALLLTGEHKVELAAERIYQFGVKLVCVTLGEHGSYYYHENGYGRVSGFKANVKDTTGAGDAFFGSLVHQVIQSGKNVSILRNEMLQSFFYYSNAVASLCIEGFGGIPSMPSIEEINERIQLSQ